MSTFTRTCLSTTTRTPTTRTPIDLLPDREAATLSQWLQDHPGVEVICRDRAGAYADGARTGAPSAIQVADRWHLWHNLAQHVEKAVSRHHRCLRPPPPTQKPTLADIEQTAATATAVTSATKLVDRIRDRYDQIQTLLAGGTPIKRMARDLGLARETVRRYARATTVEDLLTKARPGSRPSILDPYLTHIHQRLTEGCTDVTQLFTEIRALGYRRSYSALRDYVQPLRALATAPSPPRPPKVRHIASLILRHPDDLDPDDHASLADIRTQCAHLDNLATHVTSFAKMLTGRHGELLNTWIAAVEADDQPDLHSFAHGLTRDYDAVRNGLTLPHSSGAVEGHVNRIKMIKRQMYGRANFDLLRKRVLLAN